MFEQQTFQFLWISKVYYSHKTFWESSLRIFLKYVPSTMSFRGKTRDKPLVSLPILVCVCVLLHTDPLVPWSSVRWSCSLWVSAVLRLSVGSVSWRWGGEMALRARWASVVGLWGSSAQLVHGYRCRSPVETWSLSGDWCVILEEWWIFVHWKWRNREEFISWSHREKDGVRVSLLGQSVRT